MTSPERRELPGAGLTLVGDRWPADPAVPRRGTCLLLHGGGQTRHSWRATGARQAAGGWDTLSLDARGHGESNWASDGDYSIDALVADLRAVVETLAEPPVVFGASMGGMTAIVGEGENPGLVRALVLVDITPRVNRAGTENIGAFMRSAPNGFGSLDEVADAVAAFSRHRRRPRNIEGLKKNVRQRADGRWYWHWDPALMRDSQDEPRRAAGEQRLLAAAAAIRVPTLLVRGTDSDVVTAEHAAEFLALVPGAQLVEVAAGHMVAGDDNDVFTRQVEGFLNLLPSGQPVDRSASPRT
ncbi:alpha/beta hydrolase [Nakamurella silvestris]|nr:alpha/beta hydrolase [Nakamurella silvestris]